MSNSPGLHNYKLDCRRHRKPCIESNTSSHHEWTWGTNDKSLKRSTWTDKMLSWLLGRVMFGRSQPSPSKQPLAQVTSLKYSNNKYLADLKSTSLLNDLLNALMISWSGSEKRFIWAGIESVRTLWNTTPKCRHFIFYATSTAMIHLVLPRSLRRFHPTTFSHAFFAKFRISRPQVRILHLVWRLNIRRGVRGVVIARKTIAWQPTIYEEGISSLKLIPTAKI